jgi:hypothetical protein
MKDEIVPATPMRACWCGILMIVVELDGHAYEEQSERKNCVPKLERLRRSHKVLLLRNQIFFYYSYGPAV